jgi:hypothetical protein
MPFYVYDGNRSRILEVNDIFDPTKIQMHSDKIIPLEFVKPLNGDVFDIRDLTPFREAKLKEMDFYFRESLRKGSEWCYVVTSIIGDDSQPIVMDCSQEDYINLQGRLNLMVVFEQDVSTITDYYNNYHPNITLAQVEQMVLEMELRGATLHTKKGTMRYQIATAKTIEELDSIIWQYEAKNKYK